MSYLFGRNFKTFELFALDQSEASECFKTSKYFHKLSIASVAACFHVTQQKVQGPRELHARKVSVCLRLLLARVVGSPAKGRSRQKGNSRPTTHKGKSVTMTRAQL